MVFVVVGIDVAAAAVVVVAVEVAQPPLCKHLHHGFWALENQPAWRKKSGGVGEGAAPPPICKLCVCKQTACMMT